MMAIILLSTITFTTGSFLPVPPLTHMHHTLPCKSFSMQYKHGISWHKGSPCTLSRRKQFRQPNTKTACMGNTSMFLLAGERESSGGQQQVAGRETGAVHRCGLGEERLCQGQLCLLCGLCRSSPQPHRVVRPTCTTSRADHPPLQQWSTDYSAALGGGAGTHLLPDVDLGFKRRGRASLLGDVHSGLAQTLPPLFSLSPFALVHGGSANPARTDSSAEKAGGFRLLHGNVLRLHFQVCPNPDGIFHSLNQRIGA